MKAKKNRRQRSRWGRHPELPVNLAMHIHDLLIEWGKLGGMPSDKDGRKWFDYVTGSLVGIIAQHGTDHGETALAQLLEDTAKVLRDGRGVGWIVESRFAIWTALRRVYGDAPGDRAVSIADLEPVYHRLCPDIPLTDRTLATEAKRAGYTVQKRGAPKSEVVSVSASVFRRGKR